jgi:hypothetical protein
MNIITLQNYDDSFEFATYCANQEQFEVYRVDSPSQVKISGRFSHMGGILVKIFRLDDNLLLLEIAEERYVFENLKIVTHDVERISDGFKIFQKRHIVIQEGERAIFDTDYDEIGLTFENDWTPMIEDEHFDFGLFLENLSSDPKRQKRLWDRWKNEET